MIIQPYIPPTYVFAGSDSARQAVGLPGHCETCAAISHIAAHPDLGCADVGCDRNHEPAVTEAVIVYKGKDRNGTARGGHATGSPVDLIKRLFNQGWLWAIAERDGIEVGGISFNDEINQNVWWAET